MEKHTWRLVWQPRCLLLQPHTLPELILGAGTAAVGSVISDIDCGTSESSRRSGSDYICAGNDSDRYRGGRSYHWHLGLYQRLMSNSSVSRIVLACAAFLAICAYGKKTPHRSFFHSFLAGGLLMSSVGVFLPMLVPYFGIAFASHLVLDFLNHKGEQLLYPYRKRFSLGICSASGLVKSVISVFCGSVLSMGVTR
ncbi:MAG: metal-dependent hydrolase [Clostridium sp.]